METTLVAFPPLFQKRIDEFFQDVDLFSRNKITMDDLYIKTHGLKGLAMFYGDNYLKNIFLKLEQFVCTAKLEQAYIAIPQIQSYIDSKKNLILEYIDNYSRTVIPCNDENDYTYRPIRKYLFKLQGYSIKNLRIVTNAINDVVLILNAFYTKKCIGIAFVSNMELKNIEMLFSSFRGTLVKYNGFHRLAALVSQNLMVELCRENRKDIHIPRDYIRITDFLENINDGIANLAREAKISVKFQYNCSNVIVHKDIEKVLSVPLMEILKNALSHNATLGKLLIRIDLEIKKECTIIRIYNNGKKLNHKQIINQALKHHFLDSKNVKKLDKRSTNELIFNPFISTIDHPDTMKGRGVGLFEAKRMIESGGGTLTVKNCHKGLEFAIELPGKQYSHIS